MIYINHLFIMAID